MRGLKSSATRYFLLGALSESEEAPSTSNLMKIDASSKHSEVNSN
uniref:Uncharacterized protein n=1 Tax=Strongyloides papillosus TaxID=174720 RepID=A0A0N5C7R6_STREA